MHSKCEIKIWRCTGIYKRKRGERNAFANIFLPCTYFSVYQNSPIHALYRKVQFV